MPRAIAPRDTPDGTKWEGAAELAHLCLSPDLAHREQRLGFALLFSYLAAFAAANGIRYFIGWAKEYRRRRLEALGWRCYPLGDPAALRSDAKVRLALDMASAAPGQPFASPAISSLRSFEARQ
ncbi:hypothetical protein [Sphingopyxis sp. MWB1]|uniref:hypothetical protein n=1 Tax=Sphingopyxis sp. MWB1 TaxID=1537715 RepID=UPI001363F342|nr:hypothetical protein [Sphingopyxis sp. MWB1]